MEGCTADNNITAAAKKRSRDDESNEFGPYSPELKRVNTGTGYDTEPHESERVDSESKPDSAPSDSPLSGICHLDSEDKLSESNRAGDESELTSPVSREVVKFGVDILDILESETVLESQDLDSVIRTLEEEILLLSPSLANRPEVELTSDPGQYQPDLGYLLEASDDELGPPPNVTAPLAGDQPQNELMNLSISNDDVIEGLGNMVEFEDELTRYELGLGDTVADGDFYTDNVNGDFVTVDGLFDFLEGSDFTDMAWRRESLPAL